jgi:hypothetical protein
MLALWGSGQSNLDLVLAETEKPFCTAASFMFCFGLGLFMFGFLEQQDKHGQETQQLRRALLVHKLKEMQASNAAKEGISLVSISPRIGNDQTGIKEASFTGPSGDNPIVLSNLDGGAFHIAISAKQAEFLTEQDSGGKVQRVISVIKLADENAKDKTGLVARIVEIK